MSLPNKIILLLLLLVVFIAVCVYTKAGEIYSELTPVQTQSSAETSSVDVQPQPEVAQEVQTQEQVQTVLETPVAQETATQAEQTAPTQENVLAQEPVATQQTPVAPKEEESSLETQQNMEKMVEQNFQEENKQNVEISSNESVQEQINALLVNNAIVFQRMSANIANESKTTLEKIAKILVDNPTIKIEIAGHTDAKGDDSFNQTVSEQRANSVKLALVELGVDAKRLVAKGYGKTKPLVANDEEGYSLANRRVEFNIIEE